MVVDYGDPVAEVVLTGGASRVRALSLRIISRRPDSEVREVPLILRLAPRCGYRVAALPVPKPVLAAVLLAAAPLLVV